MFSKRNKITKDTSDKRECVCDLAAWVSEGVGEGKEEARDGADEDEEAGEPATGDGRTLTLMR